MAYSVADMLRGGIDPATGQSRYDPRRYAPAPVINSYPELGVRLLAEAVRAYGTRKAQQQAEQDRTQAVADLLRAGSAANRSTIPAFNNPDNPSQVLVPETTGRQAAQQILLGNKTLAPYAGQAMMANILKGVEAQTRFMSPQEVEAAGLPKGTVAQLQPDGTARVLSKPEIGPLELVADPTSPTGTRYVTRAEAVGRPGKAGAARDETTALMKNVPFLSRVMGVSPREAATILTQTKDRSPRSFYQQAYLAALRTSFGDANEAKKVADAAAHAVFPQDFPAPADAKKAPPDTGVWAKAKEVLSGIFRMSPETAQPAPAAEAPPAGTPAPEASVAQEPAGAVVPPDDEPDAMPTGEYYQGHPVFMRPDGSRFVDMPGG